jgi:hypothetical protein
MGAISLVDIGRGSFNGIGGLDGIGTGGNVVGRLKAESKSSIKKLLLIVVAIFMLGFQSSDNRCSSTFSLLCMSQW